MHVLRPRALAGEVHRGVRESFALNRSFRRDYESRMVLTKLSAMPLLCGLQTGVVIGVRPSDLAMRLVSCAM